MKGRDPWRGFDAKDAGEAVFWDSQCGAKKTEHPFPTGRAGDGPVQGGRVADDCRGHRWQRGSWRGQRAPYWQACV